MNESGNSYDQADIDSLSKKLNSWSGSLSDKERELIELLVAKAQWVGTTEDYLEVDKNIEEAALAALKSFANTKRSTRKDGNHGGWRRTTAR